MSQNDTLEDDGGLPAVDHHDDDSDLDFDFEPDAPEAADPAQVAMVQRQQWKYKITKAYLEARDVNRAFWHGTIWPAETTQHRATPSGTQQRWFLAMEHMPSDAPYYALSHEEPSEESPDESPEELSAHFPPRNQRATQGGRPETPGQLTNHTLVLIANFQDVTSGLCTLYLRVKQVVAEMSAARFLVRIVVRYIHTGVSDVFYTRFVTNVDGITGWHYLKAEDQFGVRPHDGIAQVNIRIMQDKGWSTDHFGVLWIRSLELVPIEKKRSHRDSVVSPPSDADFTLPTQAPPISHSGNGGNQVHPGGGNQGHPGDGGADVDEDESSNKGVVTRLVTSKNGEFMAALIAFSQRIEVKVWRTDDVNNMDRRVPEVQAYADIQFHQTPQDPNDSEIPRAREIPQAREIPLELAISATGEHIAVYQIPEIRDWKVNCRVPRSTFGVRLFRKPDATRSTGYSDSYIVDHIDPGNTPLFLIGEEEEPSPPTSTARTTLGPYLGHMKGVPSDIEGSIGYAAFVGKCTLGTPSLPERFVFCNGLYLDVFELQGDMLVHRNSIPLVNMSSSLPRTEACDLMVRSITNNMFLWVEENGRYCSTWDLSNGSAIGRIEITGLQASGLSEDTVMRVTCSQGIIAIVGGDNSVTTVDASSGMTISRRLFSDRIIEGVVFPSPQSDFLLVMLHGDDECEQSVLVLDPLRLDVEGQVKGIPPLSCSTVFVNFGHRQWPELGVVGRPDGQDIRFYNCRMPRPSPGKRDKEVDPPPEDCRFELRTKEPRMRRGQETCKRQVEIWKRADPTNPASYSRCVFSFIPEPWELRKAADGKILPTGDRFIVWASWTVQLWSLPTPSEPQCKLLFYWSRTDESFDGAKTFGKPPTEVVLERSRRFDSVTCHQLIGAKRFQATIVFSEARTPSSPTSSPNNERHEQASCSKTSEVITVPIPDSPLPLTDSLVVTKQCVKSIFLLAMTHSIVSFGNKDFLPIVEDGSHEDHASAIVDFVNTHINHSVKLPNSEAQNSSVTVTALTHLLAIQRISDLTARFIVSLLENEDCLWIPRNDSENDPIADSIKQESNVAVRAILGYCVRKARTTHPTYIVPVERSFEALKDKYPELLADFLSKASYIPAQQVDFNKAYVTISTFEWAIAGQRLLSPLPGWEKPKLEDYQTPILTLQLRDQNRREIENRATQFMGVADPTAIPVRYDWRVYAVPFPSLLVLGPESNFRLLAGENYFDSPSQQAILSYKWWQYGLIYWTIRYTFLLLYYGIFMAMTFTQMRSSEQVDSPEALEDLYLGDVWFRLIIVDIVLGCGLLLFELLQYWHEGASRYFWTLFNYIDVVSIIVTISCLSETLNSHFVAEREEGDVPQQFSFTIFAIVAMYLHLIVELRVFQPVGVIVNIIVQIMKTIRAFVLVFIMMVIGFTHGMVYLLYVYQTQCKDGTCERPVASDFPYETFPAFATTFFFLAGRYDAVGDDFDSKRLDFLVIMVLFYFLCSIVLLTVLVGQVTDAFTDAAKDGERAWRRQLSETLSEAEMVGRFLLFLGQNFEWLGGLAGFLRCRSSFWRRRSQPFPTIIYYMARIQEAEEFYKSLEKK